jgi:hypothetical protein
VAAQKTGEVSPAGMEAKELFMKAFEEMMALGAAWRADEVSPAAMDARTPNGKDWREAGSPSDLPCSWYS